MHSAQLLTRENHLLVEEVRKLAALMQEHLAPGSPRSPAQGDSQAQAHYALGLERGAAASPPMALFGCVAVTVAALAGALSGVAITKMRPTTPSPSPSPSPYTTVSLNSHMHVAA